MKKLFLLTLTLLFISFMNCMTKPIPFGSIYHDVTYNSTIFNKDTSQKDGLGSKKGEACASSFLNLIALGDNGIKEAASRGGISNVKAVDTSYMSVLGSIYIKTCTIAYGD